MSAYTYAYTHMFISAAMCQALGETISCKRGRLICMPDMRTLYERLTYGSASGPKPHPAKVDARRHGRGSRVRFLLNLFLGYEILSALMRMLLVCMPCMYALYVCLVCMPYMYTSYVSRYEIPPALMRMLLEDLNLSGAALDKKSASLAVEV